MKLGTIAPHEPFLDTLAAEWLAAAGDDPLAAADGLILLPTRRAARALVEAFLAQTEGRPLLLPRITAFGALDEAPLALAGSLSLPQAVPEPLRLAQLTRLVMALDGRFGAPVTADQAWPLAVELAALMDEAERAEVDLSTVLPTLVAEDYAQHWGITLEFLTIVTRAWPQWLADNAMTNPAARQAVSTPCWVMSAGTLRRRLASVQAAFALLGAHVHYAVKANDHLAVLRIMAAGGAGADVVSGGELRRALLAGVPADRIVFSGVGKTAAELLAAAAAGIAQVNVESAEELAMLSAAATAAGRTMAVALRINPDVDAGTHAKITTGRADNKCGVGLEAAGALYAHAATLPGLRPVGLGRRLPGRLGLRHTTRHARGARRGFAGHRCRALAGLRSGVRPAGAASGALGRGECGGAALAAISRRVARHGLQAKFGIEQAHHAVDRSSPKFNLVEVGRQRGIRA